MSKKPVIGYTLDFASGGKDEYSLYPWYAIRDNYLSSTAQAGGVPISLPHEKELANEYLSIIDALLVTGGDFDVPPHYYGQEVKSDKVTSIERRTAFEMAMIKSALKLDMPILGICGGHQLLNVALGGTLIQHIPDVIDTDINHEQPNPRNEAGHKVSIKQNTMLHSIIGADEIEVNSAHHQAIDEVGEGLIVNSHAPDSIIEGIEHPDYKFCLGVQWHPEFHITGADTKIFDAFISAAKN